MISIIKKILLNKSGLLYKLFFAPISNVNGIKNYKKLFSYFLRKSEASFSNYKYAVYYDNEDPAAVLQVQKWFSQSFFTKDNTLVLFRIYSSSLQENIQFLEKNNYNFYAFRVLKSLDLNKSNIKYIFYPFNSFTNPVLIKNRNIIHTWIAHGESDKLASVNPMIRMYDYIFVAGEISINRLLYYKIINQCDIEEKVLRIGMPYLSKPKKNKVTKRKMKILYAPTWEGVEIEQQYSSLEHMFGLNVISMIMESYPEYELYYMPHPSTGIKDTKYVKYVKDIILQNVDNSNFFIAQDKDSYAYKYIANLINEDRYVDAINNFETFSLVVTDISSIIASLIYYNVNYIVLVKDAVVINHLNNGSKITENMPILSLSSIVLESKIEEISRIVELELKSDTFKKFNKLVTFENDDSSCQNLEYYIDIMGNK